MLETLLGSMTREKVLIYLYIREEGYAREINSFYKVDLTPIQRQLEKLEIGSVLFSKRVGKTKLYAFNPRYPFLKELKQLLAKAFEFYPTEIKDSLLLNRRRPRRSGKPL
ncbi:MAG TPA: hypothetical protein PK079_10395 [Leptospiraceae bacterium]|nr:hypothetical protein [Leptospiraceae bacterium]HMW06167.1 hypothetical protein [Leptospiraceae bacterium]HMX30705.1 hypothetical protein [Leptospiraceae bacterium]HMY31828.1 hypothetical protein [Leptospiraceae bacterium]HMZ64944.1 hypothetical protein [Leptospiraceae bacterium]